MEREQPPGQKNSMTSLNSNPIDEEDTQKLSISSTSDRPARRFSPIPRRPSPQTAAALPLSAGEPEGASGDRQSSWQRHQEQQDADLTQRETVILPALPSEEQVTSERSQSPGAGAHEEAATAIAALPTHKLPALLTAQEEHKAQTQVSKSKAGQLSRIQALGMATLLFILMLNASTSGLAQILGPQGWAFVLSPAASGDQNTILRKISKALQHPTPTAGASTSPEPVLTPQQYINLIVQNMSLDQKLGQMLLVQFTGPSYSLDLSEMITQYNVGAVILFTANNNIFSASQLRQLTQQIQAGARSSGSGIPMIIAIDQEGGLVDRLRNLDGPRPSAAEIGATNDPARARTAGLQDAHDLASYGINLNLAPVVDVTSVYNPQLYTRTFGSDPATVTKMAAAYLQGLQESGKVLGTLKHFPGLGDVAVDPHTGLPYLTRSLAQLEAIDWAPYRTLIEQGNVYAVMVTHEIVTAVDRTTPSSLSSRVITGILRDELGFQGVVITDSLTMEGVTAHYSEDQAAVMAVKAGADLLMGPISAQTAAQMLQALKSAVQSGDLSQERIDASVRRILMLKYKMGLLQLPQ
jgi:beta-N-acetylhexosaminidase